MRNLLLMILFCTGCVNAPQQVIDTSSLVGRYSNGDDRFWERRLGLKEDGTFYYAEATGSMNVVDDYIVYPDGWVLSGHWTFAPPDRIELTSDNWPEVITVYVRRSKKNELVILEPELFEDILSTWADGSSLRYLKKQEYIKPGLVIPWS